MIDGTIIVPTRRFKPYDAARYQPEQGVGYQMAMLVNLWRREIESRMAALDLTDAQWKPLWLLAGGRADTALDMARQLEMDPGAVTRLIDRLAAKGLVERTRSTADRRVVHLRLTEAGRQAAGQLAPVLADTSNDFLRGFTRAVWEQLRQLVGRLAANGQALAAARGAA